MPNQFWHPKTDWLRGEWDAEPDDLTWADPTTGYICLISRGPHGAWCGYVAVTESHPAHGRHYHKSTYEIEEVLSGEASRLAPMQARVNDLTAHGGLTYANDDRPLGSDTRGLWWFGFDCAHAGDFTPASGSRSDLGRPTGWGGVVEYRSADYVRQQVTALAAQLHALETPALAVPDTQGGLAAQAAHPRSGSPGTAPKPSLPIHRNIT
jgi:hypothetical protein